VVKVLWLGEGIVGDDTDGHIDDLTRFISPRAVVTILEEDPQDANYELLRDNLKRLQKMTDAEGRPFEILTLPMPGFVGDESADTGRNLERLPASYANFLIANNVVLAPIYGHANDQRALDTLQKCFPTRRIFGLNCEPLIYGMGAIHCVSQQQPAI
jgi:agmatine deiminase